MPVKNLKPELKALLKQISSVNKVYTEYPQTQPPLPAILISEVSNLPAAEYDGAEYASGVEFYIRVYGTGAEQIEPIVREADDRLTGAGWRRTFCMDDYGAVMPRQKIMRYSHLT